MQLEIEKAAVTALLPKKHTLDASVDKFNFDILLRDKFPFQPPLVVCKTRFCQPSLHDGRDLLQHILPGEQTEWRPSMNLKDLIEAIPKFIVQAITKPRTEMYGRFHLGLNYDMATWNTKNNYCRVFSCQQEQEKIFKVKNPQGQIRKQERITMIDIHLVITEHHIIMLKPD